MFHTKVAAFFASVLTGLCMLWASAPLHAGNQAAAAPGWTNPTGMANSMVVYAKVADGAGFITAEGSLLAAFKDGECRGVVAISAGPNGPVYSLQAFSNAANEPGLTYQVYNADTDEVLPIVEGLDFAVDTFVGTIGEPVTLNVLRLPDISIADAQVAEGDAGTVDLVFNVTLSAAFGAAVTVDYAITDGTASAATDYTAANGTLTFAAGETAKAITVSVIGDRRDEANETLTVTLSNPANATIADGEATGTIEDDDAPQASVGDTQVIEGDAGVTVATFAVTLDIPSDFTVTVNYGTAGQSATSGTDFAAAAGTVIFAPGVQQQSINVNVFGDEIDEANETFAVNLTTPVNATLADATGIGTIFDDEEPARLSIDGAEQLEGDDGTTAVTLTVGLDLESSFTVTVDWATADGTARQPGDYQAANGTLTFAPGEREQTLTVTIVGDLIDEVDETVLVNLSNPVNATIDDGSATLTILDDDATSLSIADALAVEGDAGSSILLVPVTLDLVSSRTVTVDYAATAGSATAGTDYQLAAGTLTFAAGETAANIQVTIVGDRLDEVDETFTITLSNPANAAIADGEATVTIEDDDVPQASVGDTQVIEGDAGVTVATFAVTLDIPSDFTITASYGTAGRSATTGVDFEPKAGTVTFAPGVQQQTVTVNVFGDLIDEIDETFALELQGPLNPAIADGIGICTIIDDDTARLSIADTQQLEGDAGTTAVSLTVSLDLVSDFTVTVDWATADGTALQPGDYQAANGQLTFAPGEREKTLIVTINGDLIDEIDETVLVNLSNPVNALIDDGSATLTILDDDATSLSIADAQAVEGDAGTSLLAVPVTLDLISSRTVTVDYAATAGSATAGTDYQLAAGTLTFAPGDTSANIQVTIVGDRLDEDDETFTITLSNPTNAAITDGEATATIEDDDTAVLSIFDDEVAEGDAGVSQAIFSIQLDPASSFTVTVDWAAASGTATEGVDFQPAGGTAIFAPGETEKLVTVSVIGDLLDESDEVFAVILTDPTRATIDKGEAIGLILDDDTPQLSIADIQVSEAAATADLTITLSRASVFTIVVDWQAIEGTASALDFVPGGGTVAFAPGETSQPIQVALLDDDIVEGSEAFTVELNNASRGHLPAPAIVTLLDDDSPDAAIADVQIAEGDAGTADLVFTVTLDEVSPLTITIDYATADGTAAANADYTAVTGTLTFTPGVQVQTLAVPILGDNLDELDETFTVTLSNGANVNLPAPVATGTIIDDDNATLSIGDSQRSEGDADLGAMTFTVTLSNESSFTVTVDWATQDGTALAGADYQAATGTLTFAPGETSKQITVDVIGDALDEGNETFAVLLSNVANAAIADGNGQGTIVDDDTALLSITDGEVAESGGTVELTVSLSTASSFIVTVTAATADDTATAGADYTAASVPLTFAPGETAKTVTLTVLQDEDVEGVEAFTVNLITALNAGVADGSGTVTIIDDDAPLTSIADAQTVEGSSLTFDVTLDRVSPFTATVDWALAPGTATAGSDYVNASGTLTFAPFETAKTITVQSLEDVLDEPAETFTVTLSNLAMLNPGDTTATGTIEDNDEPWLALAIGADNISENGGSTSATVTRNTDPTGPLVVDLASSDLTEAAVPASVTIAAGNSTATFAITGVDDLDIDHDQTVTVTASAPAHASANDSVIVTDDERAHNVVYSFTIRGNQYGSSRALVANGFLVLDLERHLATSVVSRAGGTGARHDWHESGLWYTANLGPGTTYWFLTGGTDTALAIPVSDYTYTHLMGAQYPAPVNIGGVTDNVVAAFSGVWRYGDTASSPTTHGTATLTARIDLPTTRSANSRNLAHHELIDELLDRYSIILSEAPAVADATPAEVAPAAGGEGLICYSLSYSGLDAGNGTTSRFSYGGYLVLDLNTGETMALLAWRDATGYWYDIQTWTAVESFDYLVPISGRNYAFIGGTDPMAGPFSAIATDGFQFKLMLGITRTANIGGGSLQEFPSSLAGELWSHVVDGAEGVFRQATLRGTLRAPETVAMNRAGMGLLEGIEYLRGRLPVRYRPVNE